MANLSETTATPITLHINGQDWRMSPLRQRDLANFEESIRDRVIEQAAKAATLLPKADRAEVLSRTITCAAMISITSPEGVTAMNSIDGLARLVWLGLRINHPDLTLNAARDLLEAPGAYETIVARFEALNELKSKSMPGKPQPKPATTGEV